MGKIKDRAYEIEQLMTVAQPLEGVTDTFQVVASVHRMTPTRQLLALATALMLALDCYQTNDTHVLSTAHRLVFSGDYGNMLEVYKKLRNILGEEN